MASAPDGFLASEPCFLASFFDFFSFLDRLPFLSFLSFFLLFLLFLRSDDEDDEPDDESESESESEPERRFRLDFFEDFFDPPPPATVAAAPMNALICACALSTSQPAVSSAIMHVSADAPGSALRRAPRQASCMASFCALACLAIMDGASARSFSAPTTSLEYSVFGLSITAHHSPLSRCGRGSITRYRSETRAPTK